MMHSRNPGTPRHDGFTLVELAVYCALVAILSVPMLSVVLVSTRSVAEADSLTRLQERNRSTLVHLRREIRLALADTVDVDITGTLRFNLPLGYDGTGAAAGDRIAYSFENRPGFPGYGDVVPGRLRRTNETIGESHLVADELDLTDSSFAVNGSALSVTMTHAKRNGDTDTPRFSISRSLTVRPRN